MIREYRGKRESDGKFVFGWYTEEYENGFKYSFIVQDGDYFEVDPATVGQWSGEEERPFGIDKHDKIYDGDKVNCYGGEYFQGYWEHSETFVVDTSNWQHMMELNESEYVDIIGDIHDSPELMEV